MDKFFKVCKKVAIYSDHHQHKIGAVIVKRNKILSTGFNKLKTHPLSPHPFRSCHAEFVAISFLSSEQLKGSTIFVYRETKQGELANSRPCSYCYSLIKSKGIKKIVYTHEDGVKEECI